MSQWMRRSDRDMKYAIISSCPARVSWAEFETNIRPIFMMNKTMFCFFFLFSSAPLHSTSLQLRELVFSVCCKNEKWNSQANERIANDDGRCATMNSKIFFQTRFSFRALADSTFARPPVMSRCWIIDITRTWRMPQRLQIKRKTNIRGRCIRTSKAFRDLDAQTMTPLSFECNLARHHSLFKQKWFRKYGIWFSGPSPLRYLAINGLVHVVGSCARVSLCA